MSRWKLQNLLSMVVILFSVAVCLGASDSDIIDETSYPYGTRLAINNTTQDDQTMKPVAASQTSEDEDLLNKSKIKTYEQCGLSRSYLEDKINSHEEDCNKFLQESENQYNQEAPRIKSEMEKGVQTKKQITEATIGEATKKCRADIEVSIENSERLFDKLSQETQNLIQRNLEGCKHDKQVIRSQMSALFAQINKLNADLESCLLSIVELNSEIASITNMIRELNNFLRACSAQENKMKNDISRIEKDRISLSSELGSCQETTAELKSEKTKLKNEENSLDIRILSLKTELERKYCPDGFIYSNATGRCYKVVLKGMNWYNARYNCHSEAPGAHLVVIEDQTENEAVVKLLKKVENEISDQSYINKECGDGYLIAGQTTAGWINELSGTDCLKTLLWNPCDDDQKKPITYTNFAFFEKSSCPRDTNYCLQFWRSIFWEWDVVPCDYVRCSVCEVDPATK